MRAKLLLTLLFLFSLNSASAQVEDAWVYFKDKPSETSFISSPLTMLSQRALDRRTRYNIAFDHKDIPVEATYISQIKSAAGITVKAKSKWLNALHIQGSQASIANLLSLNFVNTIQYANKSLNTSGKNERPEKIVQKITKLNFTTDFNYGNAANQIQMLKGDVLHQYNFTGEGMQIAIIDAGFPNVDKFAAFQRLRDNNQILGGYDFVNRNENFYTGNYHGMSVLSAIAGYVDSQFIGTAPDAKFYLFISEDSANETPLEESLWVEAAEKADSLGVDVINTSLGYTTFDNPKYNYVYADMDGKTTFISRGAEIAFSRGMIVVNSAGNEGDAAWHYISAPADAASVLSIGAVNATGVIASFSSYGPTSDNRVKPDVCAQGAGVYIINPSGTIATSNGTSFSSPVLTGVVACLWQAFPTKTNAEIIKMVKESAHLYTSPTAQEGYGIPNFETVYNILATNVSDEDTDGDGVLNTLDVCPDTLAGTTVDTNGCLNLPSDNFNVQVIGETCNGKNNGKIIITATKIYDYTAIINGITSSFTNNSFSLLDLKPGNYEVCIVIATQNYTQCFTIEVGAATTVSGKASVVSNTASIELNQGTAPFTVYVNGVEKMKTTNTKIEVGVHQGDLLEVKTSIACEGVFSKVIAMENVNYGYPNPAENIFNIEFPNEVNEMEITVFDLVGKRVLLTKIAKLNPSIDISSLAKGLYIVRLKFGDNLKTMKIIKN